MSVKERIKEIRALPSEELEAEIKKFREKIFKMRFHGKGKDLENSGQLKTLRKDIARMYTVIEQRIQGASKPALGVSGGASGGKA